MDRQGNIHIVANINSEEVSWGPSFIEGCQTPGVTTGSDIDPDADVNLFIGDAINWDGLHGVNTIKAFFLAATSFNSAITATEEDKETEYRNLTAADIVLLPGTSELALISKAVPGIRSKSVVLGFPIDFDKVIPYRKAQIPKTVGFASGASAVKNNAFRAGLSAFLTAKGFNVSHYLVNDVPKTAPVAQGKIYYDLPLPDFLHSCAANEFFISVSKYESLSMSSIQAALLGCIPVCPAHSGFADWCPPTNTYNQYTYEAILETMNNAVRITPQALDRYTTQYYFNKLRTYIHEKGL